MDHYPSASQSAASSRPSRFSTRPGAICGNHGIHQERAAGIRKRPQTSIPITVVSVSSFEALSQQAALLQASLAWEGPVLQQH